MAMARALGEKRLSPWHNLIPDTAVFAIPNTDASE